MLAEGAGEVPSIPCADGGGVERLALSRYEVRRELGRGGTGVVYEAYDAKNDSVVALKTIEASNAESLYRLKQEFRALADVQHRNLVRFGELACEGGQWFFTMELVRGTDFVDYVRAGPDDPSARFADSGVMMSAPTIRTPGREPPLDAGTSPDSVSGLRVSPPSDGWKTYGTRVREQRLRSSLVQLVDALCAIHDAGRVHRDVKPSNVLVSAEGRVVVLDFGLVSMAAGLAPSSDEAWIVGTPGYMAPEQIQTSAVGPAADWYAVGVMLFFALTGSLPFDGPSADVLEAKLLREAPAPLSIAPGLPPDLCALAADLLRIDPAERPRSDEIRARLGGKVARASASEGSQEGGSSPFVGRAEELRLLGLALDEVSAARVARLVVIEGEPGIGKSSLVRKFLRARGERATILAGRCYEQEDVPFKGVDGIVDALSEHLLALPGDEVEGLVGGGVRYLTALFPVLTRVPSVEAAHHDRARRRRSLRRPGGGLPRAGGARRRPGARPDADLLRRRPAVGRPRLDRALPSPPLRREEGPSPLRRDDAERGGGGAGDRRVRGRGGARLALRALDGGVARAPRRAVDDAGAGALESREGSSRRPRGTRSSSRSSCARRGAKAGRGRRDRGPARWWRCFGSGSRRATRSIGDSSPWWPSAARRSPTR